MTQEEAAAFEKNMKNRPHVVILGAGASVAAIPNGDANGKKISVMNDFFQKTNTDYLLEGIGLKTKSTNLEDIYSEIYDRPELEEIRIKLEKAIYTYFSDIKIPENPTIYDFLVLSLRKKDLIATFNWDPLLLQAYRRCGEITRDLPELVFLHGNVLVGLCEQDRLAGTMGYYCPKCRKPLKQISLLYPVKKKDYNSDLYIKDQWNTVENYLEYAYVITLFGYGAPPSDVEAIRMLKNAWGDTEKRKLEQTEIIDIKSDDELIENWKPFIYSHHYEIHNSFFESTLGTYPRRTCDALFDNLMNCKFLDSENGFKENMTWSDVKKLVSPLLKDETNEFLTDLYITE